MNPASDRRRRNVAAIPSIVALVSGMLVAGYWAIVPSNADRWYAALGQASLQAADFKTAGVCYARLKADNPRNLEAAYRLAICLRGMGQVEESNSLMATLAPANAPGFPPAQAAAARELLSPDQPSAAAMKAAEEHLMQALAVLPDDPEANAEMAILLGLGDRWTEAHVYADKAGPYTGELRRRLERILVKQGKIPSATTTPVSLEASEFTRRGPRT